MLQVTNLTVSYPGRPPVVDGVSLSIDAGEVVGLSGPSGCGKSTLAASLLGLLAHDTTVTGSIRFDGQELRGLTERELEHIRGTRVALVFQESALALNPLLTVGAQIAEVVLAHDPCTRADALQRARDVMTDVGFRDERGRIFDAYPHELSGGQRQRILIAQAIVCRPALVIADEPVASLDEETRAEILALIRRLNQRSGMSFLLITHSAEVLASTADRVIEMRGGTIVEGVRPARTLPVSRSSASLTSRLRVPAGDTIVEVIELARTYRQRGLFRTHTPAVQALRGVDLSIVRGSTTGLTGRSGCGKSTLARCIAGLEAADSGQIRIDGTDITRLRGRALLPFRNQAQVIFQDSAAALNPRFTALDIISEPLVIQGIGTGADRRERAADLMTRVGLSPDRLRACPGEFSGGERQRLAIARALAVSPRLLILDEAFSGLDVATRDRIVRLLVDLQSAQGLTYLCISHDLDFLARFANDILVMEDGQIVAPRHCVPQGAVA
ncbi:MAG TPA: ABC transporter ATP-binding protein [Vicinamibacterales bacterium]|nr:ABC transporter ATP-binding protein [Vicinamibacterales bacterium]